MAAHEPVLVDSKRPTASAGHGLGLHRYHGEHSLSIASNGSMQQGMNKVLQNSGCHGSPSESSTIRQVVTCVEIIVPMSRPPAHEVRNTSA